ncbi:hypothetical protein L1987_05871 [Smallanthus sonchifolius]|uniref:Uncharacterized protein n=1 Tax=Smallanthus sonchifolius TaxID=185202 RepID=A0ACB9JWI5_9ASTR|nr:hypothetical protein L1987_05871 [Smallanthus sonchifolius]
MAEHQNDEVRDEGSHMRAESPHHDENEVEQVPENIRKQIGIEEITHNGEGGNPKVDMKSTRCTYKDFMTCKPLEFKGAVNPLESQRWIASIERAFDTCHYEKEDEVTFATNQLKE